MGEMVAIIRTCAACGKLVLGGDFVLLERADYERLESGAVQLGDVRGALHPRSRLAQESGVAAFILAELPGKSIKDVVATTRQRFGDAAPSKSAIYRFVQGLRRPT